MAQFKVITKTLSFNKPGLSPTEKNGTDMGFVQPGFVFTPGAYQNGWLAIASNKWVMASACQEIAVEPPPVDPPPPPATAYPERFQIRYPDGLGGWQAWQGYRKE